MTSNLAFLLALWALFLLVPHSLQSPELDDLCINIHTDGNSVATRNIKTRDISLHHRRLTAASLKSEIKSRHNSFKPRSHHTFHYADDNYGTRSKLAAQVHLVAKLPTLALEDMETHLYSIVCSASAIELVFTLQAILEDTLIELATLSRFYLITSHTGCNEDGERKAYLVSGFDVLEDITTIVLSVEPMLWSSIFETMDVEFGSSRSTSDYDIRTHENIRKRQALGKSTTVVSIPTFTYSFPSSSTPTATAALDMNLNHQLINQKLESFTAKYKETNGSYSSTTSESISVACKNCTLTGTIDIIHGYFTANGDASSNNSSDGAINFFEHGYMEVQANNLAAYVELESTISLSETLSYEGHLTGQPIPLGPFTIPGIANVGPYFDPLFYGKLVLDAEMNFTYGFDLTVPDGSSVILDFGDITNSSSSGFKHTSVQAIPFQASSAQISLNATMGLKPSLGVDINIFDGAGDASAAIFLDLPKIDLDIVSVTHRNFECDDPLASGPPTHNKSLSYLFDSLLNLIPSIEIGIGAGYDIHIDHVCNSWANSTDSAITSWALPTKCLAYDVKAGTFAPAVVSAEATSIVGVVGGGNSSSSSPFSVSSPRRGSAIAGIAIGSLIGLLFLGALVWFLRRHSQRSRASPAERADLLGTRAGIHTHSLSAQTQDTGMEMATDALYYDKEDRSKGGFVVGVRDQITEVEE